MNEQTKALNPTVVRLGAISFLADVSSEMLYPITPIFLTLVLGTSVAHVGMIEGMAEGTASLVKTFAGYWSDRMRNRKTFIWLGYLFAAIAKPLTGSATSWTQVLFARSFDRFGKGIRTAPRDALLDDSVHPSLRGEAFGWHRLMDTLGAALGPLIALIYLHSRSEPQDLRWIYFIAFIPGLLSVLIALSIRDVRPIVKGVKTAAAVPRKMLASFSSLSRQFKLFLVGFGVFSLTNSSDVFLLLRAKQMGQSLSMTIWLYAFYNLLYALASPYLGHLSDRLGRKTVMISGLGVFAVVYLGFGFAAAAWQLWVLFGFYGLYMAATDGVGKAFAVDLLPSDLKATGLGLQGTVVGVTTALASTIAGILWDRAGSESTFIFGAVGAVAAMIILATVSSGDRPVTGE